jgi:hypothetical protein
VGSELSSSVLLCEKLAIKHGVELRFMTNLDILYSVTKVTFLALRLKVNN